MLQVRRPELQRALNDESLRNALREELFSDDGDCKQLLSFSLRRAGIRTIDRSEVPATDVNSVMRQLEESAEFRRGTTLAWILRGTSSTLNSMYHIFQGVLERMVRGAVALRGLSWEVAGTAAPRLMQQMMKSVNDWWNNDMRMFLERGDPHLPPCR
jgi:hypothetical protein